MGVEVARIGSARTGGRRRSLSGAPSGCSPPPPAYPDGHGVQRDDQRIAGLRPARRVPLAGGVRRDAPRRANDSLRRHRRRVRPASDWRWRHRDANGRAKSPPGNARPQRWPGCSPSPSGIPWRAPARQMTSAIITSSRLKPRWRRAAVDASHSCAGSVRQRNYRDRSQARWPRWRRTAGGRTGCGEAVQSGRRAQASREHQAARPRQ